jgi:hypothetical protein
MDFTITITTILAPSTISIILITLFTIGGVVAYAILAPILITSHTSSTITIRINAIVATITCERLITPSNSSHQCSFIYIIPIITGSVYVLAVFAYSTTI